MANNNIMEFRKIDVNSTLNIKLNIKKINQPKRVAKHALRQNKKFDL